MLTVRAKFRRRETEFAYDFRTEATITGVFGRSGAGKSTLLDLVAGLLTPTEGHIKLGSRYLFDRAHRVNVAVPDRNLGVVFQDGRLFPHLSVRRNLLYGRRRENDAGRRLEIGEVAELLNLSDLLKRRPRDLSGGERQRVALGRALLSAPAMLLLDEPLASLDREHKQQILRLLTRIREELHIPMLYVTHDLTELLQLTDRLLVIEGGRSVGHGPLAEVVRDAAAWTALRGLGPLNVMTVTVAAHDPDAGLTSLRIAGTTGDVRALVGPVIDRPVGSSLRIAVRPGDIAIALCEIPDISIRNQLPARVTHVTRHADRSVVQVDVGSGLVVEVSHKTISQLRLEPGRTVWCLIKSNAVEYL